MNSALFRGQVVHARMAPVHHAFVYPVWFFGLDLEELPTLGKISRLFRYNGPGLFSVRDRFHFAGDGKPIRANLEDLLARRAPGLEVRRWQMFTSARMLGYVFNPVSFFIGYDKTDRPACAVAEVNNTFGDRHLYFLPALRREGEAWVPLETPRKEFHVSPFNDMQGEYRFSFVLEPSGVKIGVDLYRDGKPWLTASIEGEPKPFCNATLGRAIFAYPFTTLLTMPRIIAQAARLHWGKRLDAFTRPEPTSTNTVVRRKPSALERLVEKNMFSTFDRIEGGRLLVCPPLSTARCFGSAGGGQPIEAAMRIVNPRAFYRKLLLGGDVGFGEAYVDGFWDTNDLSAVLRLLARNNDRLSAVEKGLGARLARTADRLRHFLRRNHIGNSRKNISAHYDLGNDFYRLWLDPSMMYSSAVWAREDDSLEQAQYHKLDRIIEKSGIGSSGHLLEIGTGWGSLAVRAASRTQCRVTSLTLSREQEREALARVKAAGLEGLVDIKLQDYRHAEGVYDAIISIEMIEAVGHEFLPAYFKALDRLLRPGGKVVLQAILMPDARYEQYRRNCDWIQKHIFPGGHLPSERAIRDSIRGTALSITHTESIGLHYAKTLRCWMDNFNARASELEALGYDASFRRKWNYYLAYCEAGFAEKAIDTVQIVLEKGG